MSNPQPSVKDRSSRIIRCVGSAPARVTTRSRSEVALLAVGRAALEEEAVRGLADEARKYNEGRFVLVAAGGRPETLPWVLDSSCCSNTHTDSIYSNARMRE